MVEWLFLAVPWGCLRFVMVFPDHTHLLFVSRRGPTNVSKNHSMSSCQTSQLYSFWSLLSSSSIFMYVRRQTSERAVRTRRSV